MLIEKNRLAESSDLAADTGQGTPFHSAFLRRDILPEEVFTVLKTGETNRLRHLLAQGADPDERNAEGYTLLMVAVKENYEDAVEVILGAYADINAKGPGGLTALLLAAAGGNLSIARLLAEEYADITEMNENGLDAPEAARRSGRYDIAIMLEQKKQVENYRKAVEEKKRQIEHRKREREHVRSLFSGFMSGAEAAASATVSYSRHVADYFKETASIVTQKTLAGAQAVKCYCSRLFNKSAAPNLPEQLLTALEVTPPDAARSFTLAPRPFTGR